MDAKEALSSSRGVSLWYVHIQLGQASRKKDRDEWNHICVVHSMEEP